VEKEELSYGEVKDETALEWFIRQGGLTPHHIIAILIAGTGIALSLYHLFTGYAGPVEAHSFRSTHLALGRPDELGYLGRDHIDSPAP